MTITNTEICKIFSKKLPKYLNFSTRDSIKAYTATLQMNRCAKGGERRDTFKAVLWFRFTMMRIRILIFLNVDPDPDPSF
jgi:hypothetical protein